MDDTIFAVATARGRAGVAIVRVSGPQAFSALRALAGEPPPARTAALRALTDPSTGETIDEALVLGFPGPGSFTGEDTVEFQIHGSRAACQGLLDRLGALPGLRLAEAGEFTRRALMNGRLDLGQVEGLADLIEAETELQRRRAVGQMRGGLSRQTAAWRDGLLRALALVEASIDFADEDIPADIAGEVSDRLTAVCAAMRRDIDGAAIAERIRDGFEVALVGAPNVGKSMLLNALARRDAAITSERSGTTRDVLEVRMDLNGIAVTLLDMAGLRDTDDALEAEGVARARARARAADLRVFLRAPGDDVAALGIAPQPEDVHALAKADLLAAASGLAVSGLTGQGIPDLLAAVESVLDRRVATAGSLSRDRQVQAVTAAVAALDRARRQLVLGSGALELAADDIRAALRSLDFLVGRVDVEAVLDVIFESFCLGK
jgi:tRNA modification GTPase